MVDNDKIIEAEQSIRQISEELRKIKAAANILQNAQVQVEKVLSTGQKVVEATEIFTSKAGEIISELNATNLNKRLDDLDQDFVNSSQVLADHSLQLNSIGSQIKKQFEDQSVSFTNLDSQSNLILSSISDQTSSLSESIINLGNSLESVNENFLQQKKSFNNFRLLFFIIQSVIIILLIISFLLLK